MSAPVPAGGFRPVAVPEGPLVRAESLSVRFGAVTALDDVTFDAAPGDLVGVVGVAASGKSVLLKTLCLLQRPSSGRVLFEGDDLARLGRDALATRRADIGFAFQNLALFDRLDVTANVSFALERRGMAPAAARERAQEELRAVGLGHALSLFPHELSGGMKRRLALARATVARPRLGLYDDPFVGLDPVACARIARLIAAAHAHSGGVTVVAAGDPAPLLDVAQRLVLLEHGRIVADLPVSAFQSRRDPAVRRYLGLPAQEVA